MLISADVMPLLLAAAPSYRTRWEHYFFDKYYPGNMMFLHDDLNDFSAHLVDLYAAGNTVEFPKIFAAVERCYILGDSFVRDAITLALLENLARHARARHIDENHFPAHFGPETLRWWRGLQQHWTGQIPFVRPAD